MLPTMFPPHYEIFDFLVLQYHSRLCVMVEQLQRAQDIDPSEIMSLLNWVQKYHASMAELGIDASTFEEQLLGTGDESLRTNYVKIMETKLQSWTHNVIATAVRQWFLPPGEGQVRPPDRTAADLYVSRAPVLVFEMIDQQVDVAFQPGGGVQFATRVLEQCADTIKFFSQGFLDSLQTVQDMYYSTPGERSDQTPEFIVEYMMTAVNDSVSCQSYLADFQVRSQRGGACMCAGSNPRVIAAHRLEGARAGKVRRVIDRLDVASREVDARGAVVPCDAD